MPITVHQTVYRAADGKLFTTMEEAEHWEQRLAKAERVRRVRAAIFKAISYANAVNNFGNHVRADSPAFEAELVEALVRAGLDFVEVSK